MHSFIANLKYVVLVILVCEFLKELLATEKFKQYIHFAISLFLFAFFLSTFLHIDFSLPDWEEENYAIHEKNMLKSQYETKIAETISEELTKNGISFQKVIVTLSDSYEIESVQIESTAPPENIHSVLKGDFPYEVVSQAKEPPPLPPKKE